MNNEMVGVIFSVLIIFVLSNVMSYYKGIDSFRNKILKNLENAKQTSTSIRLDPDVQIHVIKIDDDDNIEVSDLEDTVVEKLRKKIEKEKTNEFFD